MKKLLILLLITCSVLFLQNESKAQDYTNAIGVRIGSFTGINFKTFISADRALDLNLSFRNNNDYNRLIFTGLYQIHNPINEFAGLKWYYGFGASIGSLRYQKNDGQLFLSGDGVLGLDYKFADVPINLALDWRPRLELTPSTEIDAGDVGLSIRFTF